MTKKAITCDCCEALIAVGFNLRLMRADGPSNGYAVQLGRRDMCGKCWGRGCEFGKKHLRRSA